MLCFPGLCIIHSPGERLASFWNCSWSSLSYPLQSLTTLWKEIFSCLISLMVLLTIRTLDFSLWSHIHLIFSDLFFSHSNTHSFANFQNLPPDQPSLSPQTATSKSFIYLFYPSFIFSSSFFPQWNWILVFIRVQGKGNPPYVTVAFRSF